MGGHRNIAHLDLDCFFVSVERVLDPALAGLPVIVGGDPGGRGVVASCSYEARRFGVRSAMPTARALALCPTARVLPSRHELYRRASRAVLRVLRDVVPVVERTSIDEAYLDLTGTELLAGPPAEQVSRLRATIRQRFRLPCSAGLAGSRLVAKVASGAAKPDGQIAVAPGEEAAFLAPRPVTDLPGIGPEAGRRLQARGVRTLGQLALLPEPALRALFGSHAAGLRDRALGRDARPVVADHGPPKSVSHETTFARDVQDPGLLLAVVDRLAQRVGRRLRGAGLAARTITLKLRDHRFRTVTRSWTFVDPADQDLEVSRAARQLLERAVSGHLPARLVGVTAHNLEVPTQQPGLFDASRHLRRRLAVEVDRLRERFGFEALQTGPSMLYPGRPPIGGATASRTQDGDGASGILRGVAPPWRGELG